MAVEIVPTAFEPAQHISARNMVSALPDSSRYTTQRKAWRRQAQENNLNPIAGGLPPSEAAEISQSARGRLKSKVRPGVGEAVKFRQEQPASRQRSQFRSER